MKKILAIITITGAVCFFADSDATAGNTTPGNYRLIQDTGRRDSTKWNKKRYKDSTNRPRRDSLDHHNR